MTPASIISEARGLLSDTDAPTRYNDTQLLAYVNHALRKMSLLRPDLFTETGNIPVVGGSAIQELPANAVRLVDLYNVVGGGALTEVDRRTLDRSFPVWGLQTGNMPLNFMRHARNPRKFFLYPSPRTAMDVFGEYAVTPPAYALGQTMDLPAAYMPQLVEYVVFLASSVDDEHVLSGRAKLFLDSFTQSLGVNLQARVLTDLDDGSVHRHEQGGQ